MQKIRTPIKCIFVNAAAKTIYDKHPVYYLAAYLKSKGVIVGYVQGSNHTKLVSEIEAIAPDLVLYSAFSTDLDGYVSFDRMLKERVRVKSVIGGPGPTFDQEFLAKSTIDALCVGEGEYALEQFIDSGLTSGNNLLFHGQTDLTLNPLIADLDSLPFPHRDIVYEKDPVLRDVNFKLFLTGRGCPYSCTYCYNNLYNRVFREQGKVLRQKSVNYVIAEMNECRKKYPYEVAVFQDDTFIHNKVWLREFCERLPKEVGVGFLCNVRANLVDEATVLMLKEGGCYGVSWSIESGCETLRNQVLKRRMSEDQMLQAAELLNRHGLKHRIGNIFGIPGETWEDMLSTLELNIKSKPMLAIGNIFVPFKGLELTQYALDHKFLRPDYLSRLPKNYSTGSVMEISEELNLKMQKLALLFPVLVCFPFLYTVKWLRRVIFSLPRAICKALGTLVYGVRMWQLYRVSSKPVTAARLFLREMGGR
jgi:radical SAM superfamily enzyme YgiQ (UPF0313 family)